jgi:uncharacterized caspase-like protein
MFALRADGSIDMGAVVRRLLWVLALGLVFALPAAILPAHAQARPADKRIALVIGNARYAKVPLSNPENDARLIAGNLRKLGFEVNEQLNVSVLEFRRALREFSRRVQEDDAIAVLYYAGHGVQIDGRNYLLPIDINLRDQEEVKDESVDIEELFLSRIDKARSHPRIVILDACRDNPFAGKTRNIRSAGGLAEMGARGTLIAFASAPGAPAEDGPSGRNSVYTKNLAEEMMVPGLEVEQMFKNVRVKVLRDTKDRQLPWVNTSLTSNFSFNPIPNQPQTEESARRAQTQRVETERAQARREQEARPGPRPSEPAGPAPRRFEPNELEKQLERAQRELDQAVAKAPQSIPQSIPQSARPAPAGIPTPLPQTRKFLDRGEVQQLLVGKTHTLKDTSAGYVMRWDIRSGGLIYYNSQSTGNVGSNGSGRWELKDDGSLCAKFNPLPPSSRLTDSRTPDDGCWYFFREGEKLMRASATVPQAQPQVEIVKIQ